jgi:hypothetical protein
MGNGGRIPFLYRAIFPIGMEYLNVQIKRRPKRSNMGNKIIRKKGVRE